MGRGEGGGRASGGQVDQGNLIAGSGVALCLTVCFFCFGIPAIFAGISILVSFENDQVGRAIGITLIVISIIVLLGGIMVIIAICTNCCGKGSSNRVHDETYPPGVMVTSHGYSRDPYIGMMQMPPPYSSVGPQPPSYSESTLQPASSSNTAASHQQAAAVIKY